MGDLITRYIWIVVLVGVILLLVNPRSQAPNIIGALSNESVRNVKALQGNGVQG